MSIATVSLALRNHPRLSRATKKRVADIARDLNYRPNPKLAQLMSAVRGRRSGALISIGAVTPAVDAARAARSRLFRGARDRAESLGYSFEEFPLAGGIGNEKRLNEVLMARRMDGIVVFSMRDPGSRLALDLGGLSSIAVGYTLATPRLHRVAFDHFSGILLALNSLEAAGHTRIGVFLSERTDRNTRYAWRLGSQVHEMRRRARRRPLPYVSRQPDFRAFEHWFMRERPDAVLGDGDALRIRDWLGRLKVHVPGEVGYADLHVKPDWDDVSGIRQNDYLQGQTAVDALANQIHLNERGVPEWPRTITVEGYWVQGKTTRAGTFGSSIRS